MSEQSQEIAVQQPSEVATVMSIIAKAAADPNTDVTKLEKLLDMQMRIMNKEAEFAYSRALSALQAELPPIQKTKKAHNSMYAPYEEVDKIIKPFYTKHGFGLDFDSKTTETGTVYYGTATHSGGFSKTKELKLPADKSGSKNDIQAIASTVSYSKRYLVGMLFNVVTTDEDDDAAGTDGFLTLEQAAEIDTLVRTTKSNKAKFLEFMKAESIQKILAKDHAKAKNALQNKKKVAV